MKREKKINLGHNVLPAMPKSHIHTSLGPTILAKFTQE
jgi:hypothetical protein